MQREQYPKTEASMKKLLWVITLIALISINSPAFSAAWDNDIQNAIKDRNFNQINIIAASNPESQGDIALFLLQQSQLHADNPELRVKIFDAATPFVGRIPAANVGPADETIASMLTVAANQDFQQNHPHEAADIFRNALIMSGQPNVVADDPNLHAEVLEAADSFLKKNPADVDKKLLEEVSLAEAGGAPEVTPIGVIRPSAD
jgi:hypothetical protein